MLLLDYLHEMRIARLHWITSVSCFPCRPAADTCLRSQPLGGQCGMDQSTIRVALSSLSSLLFQQLPAYPLGRLRVKTPVPLILAIGTCSSILFPFPVAPRYSSPGHPS